MRMRRYGWLLAGVLLWAALAACNPLADDNDATSTAPAEPTREVIVATFTPTEVVPPESQTATAEAEETEAALTATEIAQNPAPTSTFANPTVPPEDLLSPPLATLQASDVSIPATIGSYGWVFGDTPPTVSAFSVPIVQFEHETVMAERGQQFTVAFSGPEFRSPPEALEGGIYNFADNSAYPTNQQGEVGDELAFVVNGEPDQALNLDPASLEFTLDVLPGHYAVRIQGHWPDHPQVTSTPIYVTWIFNVTVE